MNSLYKLLEDFLLIYLPKERGYSKNTVISYYEGIKQALRFIESTKGKRQIQITVYDFSREIISSFLLSIEEAGKSISTRNQRLAAITSFIGYCAMMEPIYQNTHSELTAIKMKKDIKNNREFLTIDEYQLFISQINLNETNGLRYYTLINVLYDTACRVQELIDIKVNDLNYGSDYSIKIHGKGNKQRIVYISSHTAELINKYRKKYNINTGYLFLNKQNKKLTRFGVEYIIDKYYKKACKVSNTLPHKKVTPHTLRHTKSCHMLINGVALPVIQRFLGHSSIQTTEIYLEITSDVVITAVEESSKMIFGEDVNIETKKVWEEDNTLLNKIKDMFY